MCNLLCVRDLFLLIFVLATNNHVNLLQTAIIIAILLSHLLLLSIKHFQTTDFKSCTSSLWTFILRYKTARNISVYCGRSYIFPVSLWLEYLPLSWICLQNITGVPCDYQHSKMIIQRNVSCSMQWNNYYSYFRCSSFCLWFDVLVT